MAREGASGELGAGTSQELEVPDFTGIFRSWISTHDVTCQGQETKAWWESRGSDSRNHSWQSLFFPSPSKMKRAGTTGSSRGMALYEEEVRVLRG